MSTPAKGEMSLTITVPAAVPSLFQSSLLLAPSDAERNGAVPGQARLRLPRAGLGNIEGGGGMFRGMFQARRPVPHYVVFHLEHMERLERRAFLHRNETQRSRCSGRSARFRE